jgi:predicted ester cyclase
VSEHGKAIVERFRVQWLNGRDLDALHAVCHPDVAFHWGPLGDGRGVDGLQALEDRARAAFPDLEVSSDWMLADGDYVVRRSTVTGTHRGTWFGVAPTGRRAAWTCLESYRIADGRIAEQWLNEDWASVLQQLGALPDG